MRMAWPCGGPGRSHSAFKRQRFGPHSSSLSIGGDYEFFVRPEWRALSEHYRLNFASQRSFDPTLMYSAVQTRGVDVISAFTTDGRIPAFGLVLLRDDLEILPPYDAVLLLSPRAGSDPRLKRAFEPLVGSISNEEMRQANMMVDLKGTSVREAADWLSTAIGSKAGSPQSSAQKVLSDPARVSHNCSSQQKSCDKSGPRLE